VNCILVQILNQPMKNKNGSWIMGWHAGHICGCGQFGYDIYGEPTKASLLKKCYDLGLKPIN